MNISPLESLIALVTPLECVICQNEDSMLCLSCMDAQLEKQESRCYLCNKITKQHKVCQACQSRSALRRVWWVGGYDAILKTLIKEMKFHRKRAYAREFGTILASVLPYLPADTLVVPVPTASTRIRQRGFDQAVLLARQVSVAKNLRYTSLLRRLNQKDQIGKSRIERYKQMQKSFSSYHSLLPGASVLLVDDVVTTGATLEAAARTLRQHGARHVDAAVIARNTPK